MMDGDFKKERILQAIRSEKSDIVQEDVSSGKVYGTVYHKADTNPKKGVLVVHGIGGNRYCLAEFSKRLAAYGFFVLNIDLPSHFLNPNEFSLGEASETIIESAALLHKYGMESVAVIAHSMGAVSAIFSALGYNTEIEARMYGLWNQIEEKIEVRGKFIEEGKSGTELFTLNQEIENGYQKLKDMLLYSLKDNIKRGWYVDCFVLLAPPLNCKDTVKGINVFKKLPKKTVKTVLEWMFHKPLVKIAYKEGNIVKYTPEQDPEYVNWLFFKTREIHEFLEYFTGLKEPADFLKLLEAIIKFRKKDDKINFFEYYTKKYILEKPKLFIYGRRDMFLRPFMPFARRRLEDFYESCGNAEIHYGPYVHSFLEDPKMWRSLSGVTDIAINEMIIRFLDKYMQPHVPIETPSYPEQFLKMHSKIMQAVRIWKELELRKEEFLIKLRNCVEGKDMLSYLVSVKDIYDREIRVLKYCRAGLEKARDIIDSAREESLQPKGITKILGQFFLRKMDRLVKTYQKSRLQNEMKTLKLPEGQELNPVMPEKNEDLEILVELARALYAEVSEEIRFLESNIENVNEWLNKQRQALSELISQGEQGILVGNIAWFDGYAKFERARYQEFEFLRNVEKKSKKARIISKINNINLILQRSSWYLKVKPIVWAGTSSWVSWPTSFALVGLGVLSMQFAWVGIIPFAILRWAPDMALIAKEWKNI